MVREEGDPGFDEMAGLLLELWRAGLIISISCFFVLQVT